MQADLHQPARARTYVRAPAILSRRARLVKMLCWFRTYETAGLGSERMLHDVLPAEGNEGGIGIIGRRLLRRPASPFPLDEQHIVARRRSSRLLIGVGSQRRA